MAKQHNLWCLFAVSVTDGEVLSETNLPHPPAWEGMAAAGGRLFAATIDGEVAAGVVADVVRGEVFSGSRGAGVRRDNAPVRPSATTQLSDALVGTGFSYKADVRRREGSRGIDR